MMKIRLDKEEEEGSNIDELINKNFGFCSLHMSVCYLFSSGKPSLNVFLFFYCGLSENFKFSDNGNCHLLTLTAAAVITTIVVICKLFLVFCLVLCEMLFPTLKR